MPAKKEIDRLLIVGENDGHLASQARVFSAHGRKVHVQRAELPLSSAPQVSGKACCRTATRLHAQCGEVTSAGGFVILFRPSPCCPLFQPEKRPQLIYRTKKIVG